MTHDTFVDDRYSLGRCFLREAWEKLTNRAEHLGLQKKPDHHFVDGVPVLVVDVRGDGAHASQRRALAFGLAENNVRRSNTADEIRELAGRLKKTNYKVRPGRYSRVANTASTRTVLILRLR